MNTDAIRKWATALESGDYKQATNALQVVGTENPDSAPGFCCLGVLCEIAVKEDVIPAPSVDSDDPTACALYGDLFPMSGALPDEVIEWIGLGDEDPVVSYVGRRHTLSHLNDNLGLSFSEIAAAIRAEFLPEAK